MRRILPYVPEEGVFVDVGANIGLFTHYVLQARPRCRAYLFEPVRALYERCVERFAGRPNIVVEHLALAHENQRATIWKARHNPGGNSLVYDLMFDRRAVAEVTEKTVHDEEVVECRVFSEYAREKGIARVDFIKTDTEGFDYRVLEGMLPFLEACDPRPVILASSARDITRTDAQLAIVRRLYGIGYRRSGSIAHEEEDRQIPFLPVSWDRGSRTGA